MAGGSSRSITFFVAIVFWAAETRVNHAHARATGVCDLGTEAARELLRRIARLSTLFAGGRGLAERAKGVHGGPVAREHRGEATVLQQRFLHGCTHMEQAQAHMSTRARARQRAS